MKGKSLFTLGVALVITCIFALLSLTARAADKAAASSAADVEKKKAAIKEAKKGLDGTVWPIDIQESVAGKQEVIKDTLRFVGGRVESVKYLAEGFPASNFTVRLKGDDTVIWETMQTSEKQGIIFWRGEFEKKGGVMRGVLSWHQAENKITDYSFVSGEKEELSKEAEAESMALQEEARKKNEEKLAAERAEMEKAAIEDAAKQKAGEDAKAAEKAKEEAAVKEKAAAAVPAEKTEKMNAEEAAVVTEEQTTNAAGQVTEKATQAAEAVTATPAAETAPVQATPAEPVKTADVAAKAAGTPAPAAKAEAPKKKHWWER